LLEVDLDNNSSCSERARDVLPVSPIRRRYRATVKMEGSGHTSPDEEIRETPAAPISAVWGRLSAICPLQAWRKPPKSTLAIPEEEIGDLERPVGSLNTGTDCFASSLFHILAGQPEWQDPLASFSTHRSQTSPVTQLLQRFTRSIEEGTAIAVPEWRRILHGTCQLLKNIPAIAKPDCRC